MDFSYHELPYTITEGIVSTLSRGCYINILFWLGIFCTWFISHNDRTCSVLFKNFQPNWTAPRLKPRFVLPELDLHNVNGEVLDPRVVQPRQWPPNHWRHSVQEYGAVSGRQRGGKLFDLKITSWNKKEPWSGCLRQRRLRAVVHDTNVGRVGRPQCKGDIFVFQLHVSKPKSRISCYTSTSATTSTRRASTSSSRVLRWLRRRPKRARRHMSTVKRAGRDQRRYAPLIWSR